MEARGVFTGFCEQGSKAFSGAYALPLADIKGCKACIDRKIFAMAQENHIMEAVHEYYHGYRAGEHRQDVYAGWCLDVDAVVLNLDTGILRVAATAEIAHYGGLAPDGHRQTAFGGGKACGEVGIGCRRRSGRCRRRSGVLLVLSRRGRLLLLLLLALLLFAQACFLCGSPCRFFGSASFGLFGSENAVEFFVELPLLCLLSAQHTVERSRLRPQRVCKASAVVAVGGKPAAYPLLLCHGYLQS